MFAIHKENIEVAGHQVLSIKGLVKMISVSVQHNKLVMYFVRDLKDSIHRRMELKILGTGHEFSFDQIEGYEFIGTYSMAGGHLMWHVFVNSND